MRKWGARRARSVAVGLLVATLAGCSMSGDAKAPPSPTGPQRTATVTASGFTITDGSSTVSGPAAVAQAGTEATLTALPDPEMPAGVRWEPAAPGFDIAFEGGVQPKEPVTVTIDLPAAAASRGGLAFVTQDSTTGAWEGLPVKRAGTTASVTLRHFSGGFWAWGDSLAATFTKAINDYLKLRYDAPACNGKPLATGGHRYSAKVNGNGIYACTEKVNGDPTLTLRSNSPFVWTLTGPAGQVKPVPPVAPLDWAQIATVAAFDFTVFKLADRRTVLVPGGQAGLAITGNRDFKVAADVDAGLGLIAVLVAAIDEALTVTGTKLAFNQVRALGECAAGVIEAGADPDPGRVLRTVLDCFGGQVEGAAAVIVGVLTSLASLLVTQVVGLIGEVTQTNHLTISVTNTDLSAAPAQPAGPVLGFDGVGPARIGMRMTEFAAALGSSRPETMDFGGCAQGRFTADGVSYNMLSDGTGAGGPVQSVTVPRVSPDGGAAGQSRVVTAKGIHVGSRLRDVLAAYPGATTEPSEVAIDWKVVTAFSPDRTKALVFDIDDKGVVAGLNAGLVPQVQYPEGCA
ncbi:hypothetical protein V6K52_09200 [Knoellia sp. S7-12]|uniref:hypothetical protein n=1 Tax=Knoellia sp. S7-12 TaxID=3126698 RepID=UPI00336980F4